MPLFRCLLEQELILAACQLISVKYVVVVMQTFSLRYFHQALNNNIIIIGEEK